MSEVNINYKGSTIASMDASGTKTLQTSGKYCEDDVEVVYTRPTPPVPSYQTKSVTPSESAQTVTADSGYDALEEVDVGAISSTYVGSGITRRSSSSLTASGATVSVPSGYYSSNASKAVASGTAGTPTATKGTVSNHSVSVTPSVTNTTGYITGGTKNGTAVTVSASELVSGTKSITANGTGIDVTNYASVDVAVPTGGATLITKSITANGTYNASSDNADGYSSVAVNVSGGGISGVATGTLTVASDVSRTTEVTIVSTDEIGFIPTKFLFYKNEDTQTNKCIRMATYAQLGSKYVRTRSIYSTQNGACTTNANYMSWEASSSGYLFESSGNIQIAVTSSYILKAGTYTWWAME